MEVRIVLVLVLTAVLALGCRDDDPEVSDPDASDAMVAIIELATDGQDTDVWDAIHPHQQPMIDRAMFSSCLASHPPEDGDVSVTETYDTEVLVNDERFDVTGVVLEIASETSGSQDSTFMLTKIDGRWRWVWQDNWITLLNARECPPLWPSA